MPTNQINQARFSKSVKFFEKGFCDRWGLDTYNDPDAPCFFAGVYKPIDVDVINRHKGFKVIWNTGRTRDIFKSIHPKNVVVMVGNGIPFNLNYKTKRANIQIKDFFMFKPNVLGDKIYCYLGNNKGKYLMGFDMVEKVKSRTGFEMIYGFQGHDMDYVKKEYYDKCFLNIKPSLTGGFTTSTELAFMGRYTISNAQAPFFRGYKDMDDILRIIDTESKKIGTVQPSLMGDYFTMDKEWREVRSWL